MVGTGLILTQVGLEGEHRARSPSRKASEVAGISSPSPSPACRAAIADDDAGTVDLRQASRDLPAISRSHSAIGLPSNFRRRGDRSPVVAGFPIVRPKVCRPVVYEGIVVWFWE